MWLCYSSAPDASSPESSDSGIQTDHAGCTSHIDSLLPYLVTSSCRHSNNISSNNNNADDDDVDNDTNNNSRPRRGHVTGEVKPCYGQGQGQGLVEGHRLCNCDEQSSAVLADTATCQVNIYLSISAFYLPTLICFYTFSFWTRKRVNNGHKRFCCCSYCWGFCCYEIFDLLRLFHFTTDRRQTSHTHWWEYYPQSHRGGFSIQVLNN